MEGTRFGHYRLLELLGRGGMGEVWRAYDTDSDRTVALKVLPMHLAEDQSFQDRFRREARTAAALTEPHVVPIHRFGEIDGRLYVDMRLIEGPDLATILNRGPVHPGRAVMIVEQVASALHAAHRAGLVHRDVKPSNVLVGENDFAYLIDFGIARSTTDRGVTSTGQVVGTFAYMAPERFSSRDVDARSDVYSLACVLHECLTGRTPFGGNSLEEQLGAHLSAPPPRPSVAGRHIPVTFDGVIARGLAKDVRERYQTSVDLARGAITVPTRLPQPMPICSTPRQPHTPPPQTRQPHPRQPQPRQPQTQVRTPPPTPLPAPPRPATAQRKPVRRGRLYFLALLAIILAAAVCIGTYLLVNRESGSSASAHPGTPAPAFSQVTGCADVPGCALAD